jgi:hypothetical protein
VLQKSASLSADGSSIALWHCSCVMQEFEINAINTTWDLELDKPYIDGGSANNSWDMQYVPAHWLVGCVQSQFIDTYCVVVSSTEA